MTSWCTPRVTISRETGFGFMNLDVSRPGRRHPSALRGAQGASGMPID